MESKMHIIPQKKPLSYEKPQSHGSIERAGLC